MMVLPLLLPPPRCRERTAGGSGLHGPSGQTGTNAEVVPPFPISSDPERGFHGPPPPPFVVPFVRAVSTHKLATCVLFPFFSLFSSRYFSVPTHGNQGPLSVVALTDLCRRKDDTRKPRCEFGMAGRAPNTHT